MSLFARTASAVGWTTGAKIAQQALQFGLSVVLMRLLGPEAFGLIGMVLVITGFAGIFGELGFSSALVQRRDLTEEHRSTVFWLSVGLGLGLTLVVVAAAPLVARFYRTALLEPLTRWISLSFVIGAPAMVPRALLQRSMRFDVIARADIVAMIVSGAAAVWAAAIGAGVWSLVVQSLVAGIVSAGMLLALVDWRPSLCFSGKAVRDLAGYGAGLTGFSVTNYWARSADNLLIGRFMGPGALGLYARAYSLMLLPITQVIGMLAPAMFPALASIQDDRERVKRIYLRAMRLISFISFPMMLGLVAVARPFVLGLLGPEWAGVIPVIEILSFVGVAQTLCTPTGWIYTSQGRTDWMFWWGIGASAILVASLVVGVLLGSIESVAWCYLAANLILTFPCVAVPARLIGMRGVDVLRVVAGNLACAAAMSGAVVGVALILPGNISELARLVILVPVGIVAYGTFAWFTRLAALGEILRILRQARPNILARVRRAPRVVSDAA